MAKIFITGSCDGLGLFAAKRLSSLGHEVILHGRNKSRLQEGLSKLPDVKHGLVADLVSLEAIKKLAAEINAMGQMDAVIHNAGVYRAPAEEVFKVNTLAPYLLTALITRPARLIYLSSGMHLGGVPKLDCFENNVSRLTYSDTKLHVLMLAKVVARLWPDVCANALDPGWVPTKMGGPGAPDDLQKGYETQVWLASSADKDAQVSGKYFFHKKQMPANPLANDLEVQDNFLGLCEKLTGVRFPRQI